MLPSALPRLAIVVPLSAHDESNPNASGSIVLYLNCDYKGVVLPSIPALSVYVHTYTKLI